MNRQTRLSLCNVISIAILCFVGTICTPVLAQEHILDQHTLLLLHFNDDLAGAQGEEPIQATGVAFEPGIFGKGAYFSLENQVHYASAGNINSTQGTLEFWINPKWRGNDGQGHVVLRHGLAGGMLFFKDGGNYWRSIVNRYGEDGKPELGVGINVSAEWQPNEWHHCAFTWSNDDLKLYVDGMLRAERQVTVTLPAVNDVMIQLGGDGLGGYLHAVLDELRISNTVRSDEEIFKSFWNGIHGRIAITTLEILPAEATVTVDGSVRFQARATDSNNKAYDVAAVANWISTNPNVATMSDRGILTALQTGETTIFATINGIESNRATITVVERHGPPAGLTLTPFGTTVLLQWDADTSGNVVAYNLYRSETSGQFGEPVRYVGPQPFYTDYNLQPGTRYFYGIAAVDKYGNQSLLSQEMATTTDPNISRYLKIANLDMLIPIYTGEMSSDEVRRIQNGMKIAREFYFRNSKGRLNLNFTYLLIEAIAPSTQGPTYANVEADLRSRGLRNNQYDAVHTFANNLEGCYGGFVILGNTGASFGRVCGVPFPGNDPDTDYTATWVFTHEFGHVLDLVIAGQSGFPEMLFNHFPWAYPLPAGVEKFDAGAHYDGMAEILRLFGHHLEYASPWDGYIEVLDQDHDGLADSDFRVPMNEALFGSSPDIPDTDFDGLNDLAEFIVGIYRSANPNHSDTDGDGIADGEDVYPIANFSPQMPRIDHSVMIDGILSKNEKWHAMASNPSFSGMLNLQLSMYANWDDDHLYFAFQSNKQLKLYMGLDASGRDGAHTSPVKFPSGDYSTGDRGINEKSFGDTYDEDAYLVIRYDADKIYLKNAVLLGSLVAARFENGIYTIESKIPHHIGPGRGWHYVAPGAPVVQERRFDKGDVLGFALMARPLQDANGFDPYDWGGSSEWVSMFELYHFYDATLTTEDIGTAVADMGQAIPSEYDLRQNFPNPFNLSTSIKYQLPAPGRVDLTIHDALGQRVRTLVNKKQPEGHYQVQWDGRNDFGGWVASGTYFYTLKAGESILISKLMILIK